MDTETSVKQEQRDKGGRWRIPFRGDETEKRKIRRRGETRRREKKGTRRLRGELVTFIAAERVNHEHP